MNDNNLLIHLAPQQGYNNVFELGEYNMKLTRFGIVQLAKDTVYEGNTGDFEVAFVTLGGTFAAEGDGWKFDVVGGRKNVFDGKPHALYLPRRTAYKFTALTDCDFAVNESPASRDTAKPTLILPETMKELSIGRDNFTRAATVILDDKFDSEHFYIGEGMIPSGNWSGYPPHRHDFDDLPGEIDMEETYFYRFDPPQGFGIQKVYKTDGSIDETYTVKYNDTVAIAEGYHPLCGAPGYEMYYLWTMTGAVNRGLISAKDPAHDWVK